MAKKTGDKRATFTPASAKRIARAVISSEGGNRDMGPTKFFTSGGDDALVRGTFTAPWAKGATATVTDATLSAVTYTATNYFGSITTTGTKACAIGYANGEWILLAAECS